MSTQRIRSLRRCLMLIAAEETAHAPTLAKKGVVEDDRIAGLEAAAAVDPDLTPVAQATDVIVRILQLGPQQLEVVRDIMRAIDRLQPEAPKVDIGKLIYGEPDKLDPNQVRGASVIT